MLPYRFFKEQYTVIPLCTSADISKAAVQQALIQLKFIISSEYIVGVNRENLEFFPTITEGVINLKLELDENLPKYSWYVFDPMTKQLIYSAGG